MIVAACSAWTGVKQPRIKNSEGAKDKCFLTETGTCEGVAGKAPEEGPNWAGTAGLEKSDSQPLHTIKTQSHFLKSGASNKPFLKVCLCGDHSLKWGHPF